MGKGIGIAAFVIILISFIIPVVGTFVAYFALLLAAISALAGHKTFAIATTVIAAFKIYMLSPMLMIMMYNPVEGDLPWMLILNTIPIALPIICMIFRPAIGGLLRNIGISLPKSKETSS